VGWKFSQNCWVITIKLYCGNSCNCKACQIRVWSRSNLVLSHAKLFSATIKSSNKKKRWHQVPIWYVAAVAGVSGVSCVDSKLGYSAVRGYVKYFAICGTRWPWSLTSGTETGTPVTPALGNTYTNFGFCMHFDFELAAGTGHTNKRTGRRTDRRTDGRTVGLEVGGNTFHIPIPSHSHTCSPINIQVSSHSISIPIWTPTANSHSLPVLIP